MPDTEKLNIHQKILKIADAAGVLQKTKSGYENLLAICRHRRHHKLNEWSGADKADLPNFISWARSLPYAKEFIFSDEETQQ